MNFDAEQEQKPGEMLWNEGEDVGKHLRGMVWAQELGEGVLMQDVLGVFLYVSDENEDGTEDEQAPNEPSCAKWRVGQDFACVGLVLMNDDDEGDGYHDDAVDEGGDDGARPYGGNEEKEIPGEEGLGPAQDEVEKYVVKYVPNGEGEEEKGEACDGVFACEDGDGEKHDDGGEFAAHFGEHDLSGDEFEGEKEALGVVEGADVNDYGAFEVAHRDSKKEKEEEEKAGFHQFDW